MKSLPDPIPYPCFWNTLPVERTIRSPRHSQLYKAVRAWERGYPGGVFWNAAMPALCKQTQATYVVICCWVLAGTMVGTLSWMNEGILETAPTSSMMNMQHIYMRCTALLGCSFKRWFLQGIYFFYSCHYFLATSLVPRPSITANVVEDLVKLPHRMTSGGRLEVWLIVPCMH